MTPSEEWRPVVGYEGAYEVSDLGRVRGLKRGRVLRPTVAVPGGYAWVTLHTPVTKRLSRRVHHLVLEAFIGPRPSGMEVRHMNGSPSDNRLANLSYGTHSRNVYDTVEHGRHPQASKTHCPRGHEYTAANTRVSRQNRRVCRACERQRKAAA